MIGIPTQYLLFNGSIVILIGLLSGLPFGDAVIRKKGNEIVRAWRVTHSVLVIDGLMMLIIGLALPHLVLGELLIWVLVWAFVLSGYGFVIAFTIGAWKGYCGLTPNPYGLNTILFVGHIIGASGSFLGILILIYGILGAF